MPNIPLGGLVLNVLGGLITALILYLLGRVVVGRSLGKTDVAGVHLLPALASELLVPSGPLFRRPVFSTLLGCLAIAVAMFALDLFYPPLSMPNFAQRFVPALSQTDTADLRGEAEYIEHRADSDAQQTLQRTEQDVFQLMQRAGAEEKRLREEGATAAADRLVVLAETQARMLQEQSKLSIEASRKSAMAQRSKVLDEYNAARMSRRGVSGWLSDVFRNAAEWSARFLAIAAIAAFVLRRWGTRGFSFQAGIALVEAACIIGVVKAVTSVAMFELILPLYAIGVLSADRNRTLSSLQLVFGGFVLLYEKSGRVVVLLTMMMVAVLLAFGIGWFAPGVIHENFDVDWLSGDVEFFSVIAGFFGGMFGLELGRTIAAISFLSVLAGPLTAQVPSESVVVASSPSSPPAAI